MIVSLSGMILLRHERLLNSSSFGSFVFFWCQNPVTGNTGLDKVLLYEYWVQMKVKYQGHSAKNHLDSEVNTAKFLFCGVSQEHSTLVQTVPNIDFRVSRGLQYEQDTRSFQRVGQFLACHGMLFLIYSIFTRRM